MSFGNSRQDQFSEVVKKFPTGKMSKVNGDAGYVVNRILTELL